MSGAACALGSRTDLPFGIDPISISIDKLSRYDHLTDLARGIRERGREIHLDLRGLATADTDLRHKRISTNVAVAASSLLLTSGGLVPLKVWLPEHPGLNAGLVRGGLLIALAQRQGLTVLHVGDAERPDLLAQWATNWNPNRATFRRAATATRQPSATGTEPVQADLLVLANPHHAVPRERLAVEVSDNLAVPWIARVAKSAAPNASESWVSTFSQASGIVISELLYNLSNHPFATLPQVPELPPGRRKGYVEVYSTRGGGEGSHNRFHLVVADTGHGISRTLRAKMRQLRNDLASAGAASLVEALLSQQLPSYGHAEGFGYGRILELASNFNGTIDVLTEADDDMGGTIIAQWKGGKVTVERQATLLCHGTVAHATLSLEGAELSTAADQPDLFSSAAQR